MFWHTAHQPHNLISSLCLSTTNTVIISAITLTYRPCEGILFCVEPFCPLIVCDWYSDWCFSCFPGCITAAFCCCLRSSWCCLQEYWHYIYIYLWHYKIQSLFIDFTYIFKAINSGTEYQYEYQHREKSKYIISKYVVKLI